MGTIIVTGEPRSGTSLMMNTLKTLGCDILGSKFPHEGRKTEDSKRIERSIELNPEGFWEVSGLVATGGRRSNVDLLSLLEGKTVKLITRAILNIPKEIIDNSKIIFCLRNPREIMKSQTRLVSNIMVTDGSGSDDWKYTPEVTKIDYTRYKSTVGRFLVTAKNHDLWDKILVVDYQDMMYDTENQIKRICEYLEIPYDREINYYKDGETIEFFDPLLYNSTKLIRKDLYRSTEVSEYDGLAMDLYKSIKNKKIDNKIEKKVKKFVADLQIRNVKWLDDTEFKTWTIGGWDLHKSLITNNRGIRDKLQASAKINSLPINDCTYYNPTGEKYTIRRVKELSDLTRTKIKCNHSFFFMNDDVERPSEVTREVCYSCWQKYLINKFMKKYIDKK